MKTALLGSKNFDSIEYHINDSLVFLGHDVFHIDIIDVVKIPYRFNYWGQKFFKRYDKYVFDKIANQIINQTPDLVICTYRFIHPDCIKKIKRELPNVPVIHINPDAITTFEHQQIFASPYDAYFTKDPFIVDFMVNKMDLNAFYLPEALNARLHVPPLSAEKRILEEKINIDVVAFGTMYPYRAKMISELLKNDINVTLFGVPDKRFPRDEIQKNFRDEYITGSRKADVLFGSKIVFNNFHYAEISSANVKFFEIYGVGGFQICDFKSTLEEYSAVDINKFTFKNIFEAIEKIKYFLNNPAERYLIADAQNRHFHQNHTYEHRMEQVLNSL
nr:glycosyltransferase [uncultured Chryseobacterium sp.]